VIAAGNLGHSPLPRLKNPRLCVKDFSEEPSPKKLRIVKRWPLIDYSTILNYDRVKRGER